MRLRFVSLFVLLAACGDSSSSPPDASPDANNPLEVPFGTTAIVVVVNPAINDANTANGIATPGPIRQGIVLTTDDMVTATTDANGIAVLAPLTAGTRTIAVSGPFDGGTFSVSVAATTLREVALATDAGRAQIMVDVDYKSDQAVEVDPAMSTAEVNDILAVSDRVVFFKGGTYTGDLDFSGSRVTLFGEGVLGGKVILQGNLVVSGSDSRIRGTHVMGTFSSQASKIGLDFSRVDGTATSTGSDSMFLASSFCGDETITGSGVTVIGNLGAAPLGPCL